MTAGVAIKSSDRGWILAVDQRIDGSRSEFHDEPGCKVFSCSDEKGSVRVVAAGDMVAITHAFYDFSSNQTSRRGCVNPKYIAHMYSNIEADIGEDDLKLAMLIVDRDGNAWEVGEDGFASRVPENKIATIGSGGDFIRGHLSNGHLDPMFRKHDNLVWDIKRAFNVCPFYDVSPFVDFV